MSEAIRDMFVGRYDLNITYSWMFGQTKILVENYNLVTDAGRNWILSRMGSNTANYIAAIGVGTGNAAPLLANTTLGTETVRKAVGSPSVSGSPNWTTTVSAEFTSTEINNTTEVGLLNNATSGGTLITRSTHAAISIPSGSNMSLDYSLGLMTGRTITTFTLTSGRTYTYEVADAVGIIGVIEKDTQNGYAKKTSVSDVESNAGTYYWDDGADKLYIHTTNNANPNTHTIIALSGG